MIVVKEAINLNIELKENKFDTGRVTLSYAEIPTAGLAPRWFSLLAEF